MISLDSSVAAVFGDAKNKRDKIVKNLRIETVGDLLGHFPRRYIKTGELTRVGDLQVGQMLTVVGEIVDTLSAGLDDDPGPVEAGGADV